MVKEILKFVLVLIIAYYFALMSFRILDELSLITPVASESVIKNYFKPETTHSVVNETGLRIGAPDEDLVKQRASLLEQLEIEAEFEENMKQLIKSENSFNKPQNHNTTITTSNSDEVITFNDLFIAQSKYEPNETSRPTQTTKTSLGKKSKPRRDNFGNEPQASSTLIDQLENKFLLEDMNVKREFVTAATRPISAEEHESSSSDNEQKDH